MKRFLLFFLFATTLLIAQPLQSASAAMLTVNTLDDTNDGFCDADHCSLREAILYANTGDTIDFSVTGSIVLDGAHLHMDKSLTIAGPGEAVLTISANSTPNKKSRIFHIYSDSSSLDVNISGLSITNGYASTLGGGIYNQGENLKITNCKIYNNSAKNGGGGISNNGTLDFSFSTLSDNSTTGGSGGGIYNEGMLNINSSTISGNSAISGAGGGAHNHGTMIVDNSTIFDNHADSNRYWGGGIGNEGTLTLIHTTLSANSADSSGAGLRHKGDSLTLTNSIIANSIGTGDCQSDTAITDGGYNLIEGTGGEACDLSDGINGNIIGYPPRLADNLGDYGGPTLTLSILFDSSPAWDAIPDGVNGCVAGSSLDQRSEVRAGGTNNTGFSACDIGSFEYGSGAGFSHNKIFLPVLSK